MNCKVSRKNDSLIVSHDVSKSGSIFTPLFVSDLHIDSKHFDEPLFHKIMKQALEKESPIFIIGDIHDAMGTDKDPRTTKRDIKERHKQEKAYFNSITDESVEIFKPYASNIALMSTGNHEYSAYKHHEIDLLSMVKYGLRQETGFDIDLGKYYGWITFNFVRGETQTHKTCYYNHGSTGGKRSKGVLNADLRQAAYNADLFMTGHIHQGLSVPLNKYYLDGQYNERVKEILHLQMGTMKDGGEWERSKEFSAPSKFGWWVGMEFNRTQAGGKEVNTVEFIEQRAK